MIIEIRRGTDGQYPEPLELLCTFPMTRADFDANMAHEGDGLRPVEAKALEALQELGLVSARCSTMDTGDGDFISNMLVVFEGQSFFVGVADADMPTFNQWFDEILEALPQWTI